MKKLFILLFGLLFFSISEAGIISARMVPAMYNQCNSQESKDVFYYISGNNLPRWPYDEFGNTITSLISKDSFVEIWRNNGILTQCTDRDRVSNIAVGSTSDMVLAIQNYDGCVFNKPNVPKYNDPNRIDAQIHFNIKYYTVWNNSTTSIKDSFYYRELAQSSWSCYPNGNTVPNYGDCPKVKVKYDPQPNTHIGECLNYRLFWCGDGLLNRPGGSTNYTNGSFVEQCDPNDPTEVGWGSAGCSDICQPIENPVEPSCIIDITPIPNTNRYNYNWTIDGVNGGTISRYLNPSKYVQFTSGYAFNSPVSAPSGSGIISVERKLNQTSWSGSYSGRLTIQLPNNISCSANFTGRFTDPMYPEPTKCTLSVSSSGTPGQYSLNWYISNWYSGYSVAQITGASIPSFYSYLHNINSNSIHGTNTITLNTGGIYNFTLSGSDPFDRYICTGNVVVSPRCGNGVLEAGEECDNGPSFGNGCGSQCKLMTPSCVLTASPLIQVMGNPIIFSGFTDLWARYWSFNLGNGTVIDNNISFPYSYGYNSVGNYTSILTVGNNYTGAIGTGAVRPTAICTGTVQIVTGCVITVEPSNIELREVANISWQIRPEFNIPASMTVSPVLVGSWPYNIYYKTGKTYVGPNIVNEGIYTISMNAWTTNGYLFSCTGELNVGREVQKGILDIEKTLLTTGVLSPGDFVDYRISLTNIGSGIFHGAYIYDIMPASLELISTRIEFSSLTSSRYNSGSWLSGNNWVFEYSGFDLGSGQSATVYVTGQIRENALASETMNCVYTSGDFDCELFELSPVPYIQKYQSTSYNGVSTPFTYETITIDDLDYIVYRIDFANTGSTSTTGGVRIVDSMPLCVDYVSSSIHGVSNAQLQYSQYQRERWIIEYSGFDLNAGQTGYVIITGTISNSTGCDSVNTFINTGYIYLANPNIYTGSSVTANRIVKSDIVITKESESDTNNIGDDKLFEIHVQNFGPNPISGIVLTDVWPDNSNCVSYVAWTGSSGLVKDPTDLIWTYSPILNLNETLNLYISGAIVNDPVCVASYVNRINLSYIELGSTYTGDAEDHFTVTSNSNVHLTKTADRDVVRSGDLVTYTISYVNNGGLPFLNYTVIDYLPSMVQYVSALPAPNINVETVTGTTLTWNFASLAVGQTGQIILTGRILYTNSSTITNVSNIQYETVAGNGGMSASVTITYQQDGYVGVCGDGTLDEGEDCDLWNSIYDIGNRVRIGTYLDLRQNHLAGSYGNGNYYCQNCRIRDYETNDFVYQPPQCLGTNTTISVMENEKIPFWWRLREKQDQFVRSNYNCANISDDENRTIINQDSMRCTFSVYDGNRHQQNDDNPLHTFEVPCYQQNDSVIFDYFERAYKINFNKVAGKYVYDANTMFNGSVDTYGEYKLVLERVDYDYCNPVSKTREDGRSYGGICEVNFALTRPYIMQISTFGISPTATSASDFLRDFYDMKGNSIISRTDIQDTMDVSSASYGFNSEVSEQMTAFKQKYETLSISVDKNFKIRGNKTVRDLFGDYGEVKKVPNQMIFFIKGDRQLVLKQLTDLFPGTPFTIYAEGMDILIEGSVRTNGMIITDRKILFEDDSSRGYCEEGGQVVNGIFVARGGFDSINRTRNTNDNEKRCPWGNLHVKGVLIGDGVENLIKNRRSHLNDWFNVNSNNESAIKRERRNKIFEGAALLIEYNPSLWTQLPPGADSFTKTLEVYKK